MANRPQEVGHRSWPRHATKFNRISSGERGEHKVRVEFTGDWSIKSQFRFEITQMWLHRSSANGTGASNLPTHGTVVWQAGRLLRCSGWRYTSLRLTHAPGPSGCLFPGLVVCVLSRDGRSLPLALRRPFFLPVVAERQQQPRLNSYCRRPDRAVGVSSLSLKDLWY
jgi:hypothetical protein